jgi:hypothetical protein
MSLSKRQLQDNNAGVALLCSEAKEGVEHNRRLLQWRSGPPDIRDGGQCASQSLQQNHMQGEQEELPRERLHNPTPTLRHC